MGSGGRAREVIVRAMERQGDAAPLNQLPTNELIVMALGMSEGDARRGDILWALRDRGTREVLEAAYPLCDTKGNTERLRGIKILHCFGSPGRTFPDEVLARLLQILDEEDDPPPFGRKRQCSR